MGFLEDFYISGINPSEMKDRPTQEYYELQKQIESIGHEFIGGLTDGQKSVYEKLCYLTHKSHHLEEISTFVSGFKLGSRFIISSIK